MTRQKRAGVGAAAIAIIGLSTGLVWKATHAGFPLPGPMNAAALAPLGITLSRPTSPPGIPQSQIAAVVRNLPLVKSSTQVRYQYALITAPIGAFSPRTRSDDPRLQKKVDAVGHPVDLPVWIVSVEGVTVRATRGPAVDHEENLVYDATDGQVLWAFNYR